MPYNPIADAPYATQAHQYLLRSVTFHTLGGDKDEACFRACDYLSTMRQGELYADDLVEKVIDHYGSEKPVDVEIKNRDIKIQLAIQAMNHVPDSKDRVLSKVIKALRKVASLSDCPEED